MAHNGVPAIRRIARNFSGTLGLAARDLRYPYFATSTPCDFMTLMTNRYEGGLLNEKNTHSARNILQGKSIP